MGVTGGQANNKRRMPLPSPFAMPQAAQRGIVVGALKPKHEDHGARVGTRTDEPERSCYVTPRPSVEALNPRSVRDSPSLASGLWPEAFFLSESAPARRSGVRLALR